MKKGPVIIHGRCLALVVRACLALMGKTSLEASKSVGLGSRIISNMKRGGMLNIANATAVENALGLPQGLIGKIIEEEEAERQRGRGFSNAEHQLPQSFTADELAKLSRIAKASGGEITWELLIQHLTNHRTRNAERSGRRS